MSTSTLASMTTEAHSPTVLADFILSNRGTIIARAQARVAARTSPTPSDTELENGIPVFLDFRTLNLCLDDAIAEAVTEYSRQRERSILDQGTERLGVLAHEMRNLLNTSILSFDCIKSGRVAVGGSTGIVHG